jgi:multicomponent Na+:H+ antiporter subunit D
MTESVHPSLVVLAAALLAGVTPSPWHRAWLVVGPASALVFIQRLGNTTETATAAGVIPLGVRADALAYPFATIFAVIAFLAGIYAWRASRRCQVAGLVAAAAAIGIVYAPDWLAFYASWEVLAIASAVIIHDGARPAAGRAAYRYLLVHLVGGASLLIGLAQHVAEGGDRAVGGVELGVPGVLILIGICINAAVPPLHAWLTDAYPRSSAAGAVVLSAFATKSAVYALARVFPGLELLVWGGTIMALYGVIFAVLENNIRRLLAYHIVSQVGYMVAGVGLGTPLALAGAVAHAFCHILYKGLLFMAAGAVVDAAGSSRLNELGGLRRALPGTFWLYMIGALSISGAPLLNGFVSKSLIVSAAADAQRPLVAASLTLAAVGTFLSVGLKLPVFAFGGPRLVGSVAPLPVSRYIAMSITALLCVVLGVRPDWLYLIVRGAETYEPYTWVHVLEALQLLSVTALGFVFFREKLRPRPTTTLDFDRVYRAIGRVVLRAGDKVATATDRLEEWALAAADIGLGARPRTVPTVGYSVGAALVALALGIALFARS